MEYPCDPRGEGSSFQLHASWIKKSRVHFFRPAQPKVRSYYEERVITEHLATIPTLHAMPGSDQSPPSPQRPAKKGVKMGSPESVSINRPYVDLVKGKRDAPREFITRIRCNHPVRLGGGRFITDPLVNSNVPFSHRRVSSCGSPQKRNASFRVVRPLGWRPVLHRT